MATERSDHSSQTERRQRGLVRKALPRLSKENIFTLLSLWMESFPKDESEDGDDSNNEASVHRTGVVVVKDGRVVGLNCSGPELHAAQVVIVGHGGNRLSGCQLYFSRRPCATCLKLIMIAGVSQITFWPGDPEVSLLRSISDTDCPQHCSSDDAPGGEEAMLDEEEAMLDEEEAMLDAAVMERLNVRFLLEPLAPGLAQYIDKTSQGSDFMKRVIQDDPGVEALKLFSRQRSKHLESLSRDFLVGTEEQHRSVLTHMGLENYGREHCLASLRQNMRELLGVLASVAAGVPLLQHGFYSSEEQQPPTAVEPPQSSLVVSCSTSPHQGVSQEVARHCIVQARMLSYQTDLPKAGVGAVIWAKGQGTGCGGTGQLYLLGCGYNAYPVGFPYTEYLKQQQQDQPKMTFSISIHAEQYAFTFRTAEIKEWEPTMMFITKCPCDECVPQIRGAGITHIYTADQDSGKDKGHISYLRFGNLKKIKKFVWQKKGSSSSDLADGLACKQGMQAEEKLCNGSYTLQDISPDIGVGEHSWHSPTKRAI